MTTEEDGGQQTAKADEDVKPHRSEWPLILALVVPGLFIGLLVLLGWRAGVISHPMSNHEVAELTMENLQGAIQMYYLRNRKMPQTLEALTEEDPKSGEAWLPSIPMDPWGTPYQYTPLGGEKFMIVSFGEDGQEGTEDDISLFWPPPD